MINAAGLNQEDARQTAKSEYERLKTNEDYWKTFVISCNMKAAIPVQFCTAPKVGFQESASILKTGANFYPAARFKHAIDATNFVSDEIFAGALQLLLKAKKQRLDD
eukprot:2784560-Rhodomonas_salina.1